MSYENPAGPQGGSPINKYFEAQSRTEALYQKERQRQDILKRQKEKERQANINRMQEMQYKVDMLSLKRADELGKITENPTLDNEVTGILRDKPKPFANSVPIISEPINPGPRVKAIAEISFNLTFDSFKAESTTGIIFDR